MHYQLDREILTTYHQLNKYRQERLRMESLLHPDTFKRTKELPKYTESRDIKLVAIGTIGWDENYYLRMQEGEELAKKNLGDLIEYHPLWEHFQRFPKGFFGHYLAGCFVAAGGAIERCPRVSSFWKGMGLDVLPDGSVPRRIRGKKGVERKIPALPHVTLIGEQIRAQLLRKGGYAKELYDNFKEQYNEKRPKGHEKHAFNHRAALRNAQKCLYYVLWKVWREGYELEAPEPDNFEILVPDGTLIRIEDFYS